MLWVCEIRIDHPLNYYSTCENDLGVHMDNKFNFDQHISNAIYKVSRVMGVAKATFDNMGNKVFQQIFKGPSLTPSRIFLVSLVLSSRKQKDAMEAVQRRTTKWWFPECYDIPYNERLWKLMLPTLAYRRAHGNIIQAYKILCPSTPESYDISLQLS